MYSFTEATLIENIVFYFLKKMALKRNKNLFGFDRKSIQSNRQSILYLIGQLQAVHNKEKSITLEKSIVTYSSEYWTKELPYIYKLLHLAASPSIGAITPFNAKSHSAEFKFTIEPTLSPRDPKFPEWRKGYEAKMKKKSEGQEPFDD